MNVPPTLRRVAATGHRHFVDVPLKAGGIIRDYVLDLYFEVHQLRRRDRLRCIGQLSLVEYLIYQVDAITESVGHEGIQTDGNQNYQELERHLQRFERFLNLLGGLNDEARLYLHQGRRYVETENTITSSGRATHAEVVQALELRPSDVRMLHGMIFALLDRPAPTQMFDLLWPVEVLADIRNDVDHYANDVRVGGFNTYAWFGELYGEKAPDFYRQEIDRYEAMFAERLSLLPAQDQERVRTICQRRYADQLRTLPDISLQVNNSAETKGT